jgi:hypothetical protein
MTTTKKHGPSWSDVKQSIALLGTSELIQLIASLYGLSKGNRDFLHARFSVGDDPIGPYKKVIEDCMFPGVFKNKPVQISTAKKAISEYSKAVGDAKGEAELMTHFVECGINLRSNLATLMKLFMTPCFECTRELSTRSSAFPRKSNTNFESDSKRSW